LENVAAFLLVTAIEAEGKTVTFQLSEIVNGIIGTLQKHCIENKAIIVFNEQTLYSYATAY
jgi:hypothetical protein